MNPTPSTHAAPGMRLLPQPALSVVLLITWNLAQPAISAGSIVFGALVAWVVPLITARFWPDYPRVKRWWRLFRLLGVVLWDIVVANLTVARQVLGPVKRLDTHFIPYPLALQTDYAITLLAAIITLTPGTVSCLVSDDRKTLHIHVLHAPDPAAVIADIQRRYEAPLKEIFE